MKRYSEPDNRTDNYEKFIHVMHRVRANRMNPDHRIAPHLSRPGRTYLPQIAIRTQTKTVFFVPDPLSEAVKRKHPL